MYNTKKMAGLLGAAAVMVSMVGALIGSTFAAAPTWTAAQPNSYKVLNMNTPETITLRGAEAGAWSTSESDAYASVEAAPTSAKVSGTKAGVTTISAATTLGQINTFNRQVVDPALMSSYSLADDYLYLRSTTTPKESKAIQLTTEPSAAKAGIAWSSSDESVATVAKDGTVTAVKKGGSMIIGTFTDMYGQTQHIHVLASVDVKFEDTILGPDANGDYWKPVNPDGVYEKVDQDGTSKVPEEFIYDKDGDPTDGNGAPAAKDENGDFWVENPKNIWTPIDKDGNLNNKDKVWGGNDAKPGNKDDKPVENFGTASNPDYWVNYGENVYAKVSANTGKVGSLTGGGLDEDPTTNGAAPIYDYTAKDGHFYYGPFTDKDGDSYYVGDKKGSEGDGLINTENKDQVASSDAVYYLDKDGNMVTKKPVKDVPATGIELAKPESDTLYTGGNQKAPTVTIQPANATTQTVEWSSSNPDVVTVDPKTGEITAVASGTATITATVTNPDGSKVSSSYSITVNDITTQTKASIGGKQWDVLDVNAEDGKALVMTSAIDFQYAYNSINGGSKDGWIGSTLRSYLNGMYLANTFSEKERAAVLITKNENPIISEGLPGLGADYIPTGVNTSSTLNQIYVLSEMEAIKYYSVGRGGVNTGNNTTSWTLRTICDTSGGQISRAVVYTDNKMYGEYGHLGNATGVRPAMWIDLSKTSLNAQGQIVIQ